MAKNVNETLIDDAENQEIKDYAKPLTAEDVQREMRLYMDRLTLNKVSLAGKVISLEKTEPKQRVDKKTNLPVLDGEGNPQFYDAYHYATIAFEGGEVKIEIKPDWYNNLTIDSRISLEGRKGLNKFKQLDDIFHSYTLI